MKYLVFDLEKASCKNNEFKVCEFGYVLTDDKFKVIRKGNFYINPNIPSDDWDSYALTKILYREQSFYEEQPTFDAFYDEIRALFQQADFVYGHTVDGDVQGINDECKRYNLSPINYDFYDIKEFYKILAETKENVGVTRLREIFGITEEYQEHDAESDAYTTMLELKAMLNQFNITLEELLTKNPSLKDTTRDFVIDSYVKKVKRNKEREKLYKENLAKGEIGDGTNILFHLKRGSHNNKRIFLQFLDNVQVTKPGKGIFKGKKVSMSLNYEYDHFKQMMNIVQILANEGGKYVYIGAESDLYVRYDIYDEEGKPRRCPRLKYVEEANANGKCIEIITFDKFLSLIGLTSEELDALPFPSLDCLSREDSYIKDALTKREHKRLNKENNLSKGKKEKVDSGDDYHIKQNLGDMFKDILDKIELDTEEDN